MLKKNIENKHKDILDTYIKDQLNSLEIKLYKRFKAIAQQPVKKNYNSDIRKICEELIKVK